MRGDLQLIPKQWISLLFAATALTMAITPLLLLINEKWIVPMMGMVKVKAGGFEDDLDYNFGDITDKKVIIAGYGDFGNTVGRIIKYSGFSATVLDKNSERVELLRKLGFNVHFGDATNLNTLKAAKADKADILIAAMDSPDSNLILAELAQKNFPNLKIFIRAQNRFDAYNFLNKGHTRVYRETFYTALQVGVDALEELGLSHEDAIRQGEIFAYADRTSLKKLSKHSTNLEDYIAASRAEIDSVRQKLKEGMELESLGKENENGK